MSLRGSDPAEIGGYPLEARLGSGGMGTVFLARTSSGRPVAIKLIHQQFAGDEEFRIRFRQEVAAARRVSGAFTAAVVDAAPEAEQPWMATTYIEGQTLAQHIAAAGPLDGVELRRLAIGLAEALRDIHRVGVVHRDLKPSNVVLSAEGPRVIDFGISRAADQQTLTMTGRVIGTPPFMSPEQLQAPRGVGPASDIFSLGTLLVYAATGSGPFDADSPYMTAYQVVHEEPSLGAVPEALRAVVGSCLDKEPAGRPSADDLLVLLRDLPADLGGAGPTGTRAGRTRDVITQHHDALPTPASTAVAEAGTTGTGTSVGRRLRDRWRPVLAAAAAAWARVGAGLTPADRTALGEELARRRRAPGPAAHRAATERAAALLATGLPGEFGAGGRSVALPVADSGTVAGFTADDLAVLLLDGSPMAGPVLTAVRERLLAAPSVPASELACGGSGLVLLPAEGRRRVPRFQLAPDGAVRPVVLTVNRLLDAEADPWGAADWWLSPHAWLGAPPAGLLGTPAEAQLPDLARLLTEVC
ncbi:Serine/threonine protein kinase [Streptomyces sp. IgraMP-1]|nr:Serine/threonine protein kinase [Streptomyces sp. IgraMP-1]